MMSRNVCFFFYIVVDYLNDIAEFRERKAFISAAGFFPAAFFIALARATRKQNNGTKEPRGLMSSLVSSDVKRRLSLEGMLCQV